MYKKSSKGAKATPLPASRPLGGFSDKGKIVVIGRSTASKLAHHLKNDLNIKGAVYNKTKAPLNDFKVKSVITYLEGLRLGNNETVILDLTCNFAPEVLPSTGDKTPFSTGVARSKKFHLYDSEGRKVRIPNSTSIK